MTGREFFCAISWFHYSTRSSFSVYFRVYHKYFSTVIQFLTFKDTNRTHFIASNSPAHIFSKICCLISHNWNRTCFRQQVPYLKFLFFDACDLTAIILTFCACSLMIFKTSLETRSPIRRIFSNWFNLTLCCCEILRRRRRAAPLDRRVVHLNFKKMEKYNNITDICGRWRRDS